MTITIKNNTTNEETTIKGIYQVIFKEGEVVIFKYNTRLQQFNYNLKENTIISIDK